REMEISPFGEIINNYLFPDVTENFQNGLTILNPENTKNKFFSTISIKNNQNNITRYVHIKRVLPCGNKKNGMLYWVNSVGGIDWVIVDGMVKTSFAGRAEKFVRDLGYNNIYTADAVTDVYYNAGIDVYYDVIIPNLHPNVYNTIIRDIVASPAIWLYTVAEGLVSVVLENLTEKRQEITPRTEDKAIKLSLKQQITFLR
ncbi:MAG: hypothetical protein ABIK31_06465, partial [candidate division WOR-3 bacterium]